MPLSPLTSGPKVFSVNVASSVLTSLLRIRLMRVVALKSLASRVRNAREDLRGTLTLLRSRGDR